MEFESIGLVKNTDGFHIYLAAFSQYGSIPIREVFIDFRHGSADVTSRESWAAQIADAGELCRYLQCFSSVAAFYV